MTTVEGSREGGWSRLAGEMWAESIRCGSAL